MKAARYFPLAYLANVHGFILLAPYLILCLTILRTVQAYRVQAYRTGAKISTAAMPLLAIQA